MPPPNRESFATLLCTVRACSLPLVADDGGWTCSRGHRFDRARRGWVNLLQPQDSRSRTPGDTREMALARRRLVAAGLEAPLLARLSGILAEQGPGPLSLLDVGCGEGSALAWLAARHPLVPYGVDLSTAAIDLAATQLPDATWAVVNADRVLPFADSSFDAALSLLARRPAAELARVLRPHGTLLVVVPAPGDLAELRATMFGAAHATERLTGVVAELTGPFALRRRERLEWKFEVDRMALSDLLRASYRGQRPRERAALFDVERLEITSARDIGIFERL